ncbi:hypothetical protein BJ170DRAFT_686149 [Xylariales sp. AK1849]|nr:hypothetical protein BJ170DRAFT_686149 [Xylariales sp. AK1849]
MSKGFRADKKSGYDPAVRVGHHNGPDWVGEWILQPIKDNYNRMKAALFATGPYIEMAIAHRAVLTPTVPSGGQSWCTALDDRGYYVKWLFDDDQRVDGVDVQAAIGHITYNEMATAFTEATDKPA